MQRFRPYRKDEKTRDSFAEIKLDVTDFICPVFVMGGKGIKGEVNGLKGVYRFSIDRLLVEIKEIAELGINKILIFGVIQETFKDCKGSYAYRNDSLVAQAIREIKKEHPSLTVISDVCLCGYTSHGHCGITLGNEIDNDATLPLLAEMALMHAKAGADFVAPSAMMDGQIEAIRTKLGQEGLNKTKILAYSNKYASNFYGPFRSVANSDPTFGDRKSYQMDYRTRLQGIDEAESDIGEGADWIMVKPAHTYLDMIRSLCQRSLNVPLVAYHVSGEYMMIVNGASSGLFDETKTMMEVLYAIKRAGADMIISYFAKEAALLLKVKIKN